MSLMKICITFYFHATIAALYLYTWAYAETYVHHKLEAMVLFAGAWKFLTHINMVSNRKFKVNNILT